MTQAREAYRTICENGHIIRQPNPVGLSTHFCGQCGSGRIYYTVAECPGGPKSGNKDEVNGPHRVNDPSMVWSACPDHSKWYRAVPGERAW